MEKVYITMTIKLFKK